MLEYWNHQWVTAFIGCSYKSDKPFSPLNMFPPRETYLLSHCLTLTSNRPRDLMIVKNHQLTNAFMSCSYKSDYPFSPSNMFPPKWLLVDSSSHSITFSPKTCTQSQGWFQVCCSLPSFGKDEFWFDHSLLRLTDSAGHFFNSTNLNPISRAHS